jgi:hypothetical protein
MITQRGKVNGSCLVYPAHAKAGGMINFAIQRPEPAEFAPLDPTDADTIAFDWSSRATPGDALTFATVTASPAGAVTLGPAFINVVNYLAVEVQIAPVEAFCAGQLPLKVDLRCTAFFASGRISNYSVPITIKTM